MREGYGALSHIGSAIANAMRSPTDPTREPGLVVPGYNQLAKGVIPRVGFSYWRGEDLVNETHTDRSMLVGAAGALGVIEKIVPIVAVPAAFGVARRQHMVGMADESGIEIVQLGMRAMPVGTMSPAELMVAVMPSEAAQWPLMGVEGVK